MESFLEYEAPDYTEEGIEEFFQFLVCDNFHQQKIMLYDAYLL